MYVVYTFIFDRYMTLRSECIGYEDVSYMMIPGTFDEEMKTI